jgi:catechol 2,3-dioxygenase-like lactoylglutathione lyase family enzyme
MAGINGVHHIAVMAGSIKTHIAYFTDVLGCKLNALFFMHGVPGAYHAFLEMDENCYFSVVETPEAKTIPIEMGKTHSGNGALSCAPGTMQHIAFRTADEDSLLGLRDRIREHGINVFGPINHGFCKSIYFAGPDHLTLEISTQITELNPEAWIDPEVVALTGISSEELARYKVPAPSAPRGGKVAQPAYDPAKPHMRYPEAIYQQMLKTPDEVITAAGSVVDPPVKLPA